MATAARAFVNVLVARQLEDIGAGNGAYLLVFLRCVRQAGLSARIIFAPRRSFGNRPWMSVHPAFAELAEDIRVPASIKVGSYILSRSVRVWLRFLLRLMMEAQRRMAAGGRAPPPFPSRLADELPLGEAKTIAAQSDAHPSILTVAEYSSLGPALSHLTTPTRRSCLVHDLFSLRAEAFIRRGETPDFPAISLEEEARRLSPAETLFFASANEMERLQPILTGRRLCWLRPETPAYPAPAADGAARIVFIGTRHAGNTEAITHFLRDIWMRVRERHPDSECWIVGSVGASIPPELSAASGVRLLGKIDRLETIGGPQAVGIAPTRVASGVSIKVAEYLRLGMPCVCYRTALEGFGDVLDDLVEVAASEHDFADRLGALLDEAPRREAMSREGREQAGRRLDNSEIVGYLRDLAGNALINGARESSR
jgi:hypothetical protein